MLNEYFLCIELVKYVLIHLSIINCLSANASVQNCLLKNSWFGVLCEFLLYSKVTQLYIHICIYMYFLYSFPSWFITGYWIYFPAELGFESASDSPRWSWLSSVAPEDSITRCKELKLVTPKGQWLCGATVAPRFNVRLSNSTASQGNTE